VLNSSRLGLTVKTSSLSSILRFGVFELDPRAGELRKKGMKISLQGQPVEILVMLLERPGEIVSREELQKKLWPADTFVDFDHGLNSAIKRLRAALDDNADTPRFIETLPRRGYRFIGSVAGPGPAPAIVYGDNREGSLTPNLTEAQKLEGELFLAFHYMRGQAHLVASQGKEAAEEFRRIIDHRGSVPNFLLNVLAHLGLARAHALQGETEKSRAAYNEFFAFWEGTDYNVSLVQQARMEYARLQ
jgi:DNA-binding winged helix-turn-helix (wHTH) protein